MNAGEDKCVGATDTTQIANCASNGNWANACSQCNTNHTYNWGNGGFPEYNKCVVMTVQTPNCHAYKTSDDKCMICNKGFHLNQENQCETMTAPNCAAGMTQLPVTSGDA